VSKVSAGTSACDNLPAIDIINTFQVLFDHLPQQRWLDSAQQEEVSTMLGLKTNKKMVQQHISSKNGQIVLLKDIYNIANHPQTDRSKDFEAAIQELQKAPG